MQIKTTLLLGTCLLLSGCMNTVLAPTTPSNDPDAVMNNWVEEQTVPPPVPEVKTEAEAPADAAAAPETTPVKKSRKPKIEITEEQQSISANPNVSTTPTTTLSWQPNEAHIFRGMELLNGLKADLGRQPTVAESQQRLQSHMGLSAAQAQKLYLSIAAM